MILLCIFVKHIEIGFVNLLIIEYLIISKEPDPEEDLQSKYRL